MQTVQIDLPAGALKEMTRVVAPREYLKAYTEEGVRPDGRGISEARKVSVSGGAIQSADGSALVHIGDSSFIAAIKCEVAKPAHASPKAGFIDVSVHLGPACSPDHKIGRQSDLALSAGVFATRTIVDAKVVGLEELCIAPEKAVWILRIDVVCLNDDGGIFDGALLSAIAALANLQIPCTRLLESGEVVTVGGEKQRLELRGVPSPLTVAVFDGKVLVDPTAEETRVADDVLTVAVSEEGELCGLLGSTAEHVVEEAMNIATVSAGTIAEIVSGIKTS
eukprot:g3976.t1